MEGPKIYYPKTAKTQAVEDPKTLKVCDEVRTFAPLDPSGLLSYYQTHGSIKLVGEACPFLPELLLRDASFKDRQKEDELYLRDPEAVARLRRGNSLVVPHTKSSIGLSGPVISRRGLPKFFDLRKEHLKVFLGEQTTEQLTSNCGQNALFEYKNILAPVLQKLKQGMEFNVYRSGKANGENAQISLVRSHNPASDVTTDIWVVCSKNVSLLMRNEADLKHYNDQRFSYAKMIGACWLKIFNKLDQAKQDVVKQVTSTCTLVGEYCGHSHLQHLVRYPEETLIFYAIVPKDCSFVCWDMAKTFSWLDSVSLEKVTLESVKGLKTAADIAKVVDDYNDYLAVSDVQTEGEGSVVYFEAYTPTTTGEPADPSNPTQVVSMCKLKTLEYRFLRKMREKIKGQIRHGSTDFTKTLQKFEKESLELISEYPESLRPKLPSIQQYKDLLQTGLNVVINNQIPLEVVERSFLDVLELFRACHTEKRSATKEEITKLKEKATLAGQLEALEDGVAPGMLAENAGQQNFDGKADPNMVNVCLIDIPGLFNLHKLLEDLPKNGFALKMNYEQKKELTKDTLRVVNIVADSIDTKKLKPNTYLLVPTLGTDELPEELKRKMRVRIEGYFEKVSTDTTGILSKYLSSATNSINKVTNIEHSIDLSLKKVARISKSHKRVIQVDLSSRLGELLDDKDNTALQATIIKEVVSIRTIHLESVRLREGTSGKVGEDTEEMG